MTPLSEFIAIDPGFAKSNGTGWCIVRWGKPDQLGLATANDHDASLAVRCEQIRRKVPTHLKVYPEDRPLRRVIEHMRSYPFQKQKGDQNDLIDLAYLEGVLAAGGECETVDARTWKGNVPKIDVMQPRILKRLAEDGLMHLLDGLPKAKEKRGSILEAAGLAYWRLGRLGR